jgi:mRNA-degrading endonuclease RelE of RelBE toxin-antitoxin system
MGRGQTSTGNGGKVYEVIYTDRALKDLKKLSQKECRAIFGKIQWLAENADVVKHERMVGHKEYSLHVGQFRILYLLDRTKRRIVIQIVGKHDEAYRRLKRR